MNDKDSSIRINSRVKSELEKTKRPMETYNLLFQRLVEENKKFKEENKNLKEILLNVTKINSEKKI